MDAGNDFYAEPTLFAARLTPHRSLGSTGFLVLMGVFGAVSFAAGIAFMLMGAWPVFGFFGLDVLAIYIAFRINYRRAGASEDVHVTPSVLHVRRTGHRGDVAEWSFNPLWVRLEAVEDPEFGIERLALVSRGHSLSIARALGPDEKASFAAALQAALQAAKRGPVYNPLP